jgi:GTP diphosphokinase / guanosine-3',5'-bis(diphosphate) 3'-diphosphatase
VYPEDYKKVLEVLQMKTGKYNETLERERKVLQKRLADSGLLDFHTSYRVKGLFSLYHKLKRKDWDIAVVYDLLAMRIVVTSVEDCYRTLGIIHELWRPLPGRVKDYIAFPKPNGYKSIHTTVTTQNSTILEIQIRTKDMHQESEFGIASHLIYKQPVVATGSSSVFANLIPSLFRPFTKRAVVDTTIKETADVPHTEKIPNWINQIGSAYTKEQDSEIDFINDMRDDFFTNRIFVFTPKGDVVDLPLGATPVDFAFAIHSEIGNHMAGVKVNKKLVQFDTALKNGDMVDVETKKSAKPTKKWLDFAKTSVAKRHIRSTLEAQNQ